MLKAKPEVGIQFGAGGATRPEELEAEGKSDPEWPILLAKQFIEAGAYMVMIESEGITESVKAWRTDVPAKIINALGQGVNADVESRKVDVKNGNGKHNLGSVATLVGQLDVTPEENLPAVQLDAMVPQSDRLAAIVKLLLLELGMDIENQHFRETPERVARFYREFTRGLCVKPETILKTFRSEARELVALSAIDFFSLCPHHLLVYGGKIHFGYIPNGQIVGVSKIPRLVHAMAAQPIVQEDLVSRIADAFMSVVKPSGCIVKGIAKHDCVAIRGVHCPSVAMTTVTKRGIFAWNKTYTEEFDRATAEGALCAR